jgi:hypothetical protein
MLMAVALLLVLAASPDVISADDTGTNFFLKASKSVPRIGRRSEYDIYHKTSKNVPRIGRRREMSPLVSDVGRRERFEHLVTATVTVSRSCRDAHYRLRRGSWHFRDKTLGGGGEKVKRKGVLRDTFYRGK